MLVTYEIAFDAGLIIPWYIQGDGKHEIGPERLTGEKLLSMFALRSVSEYHVSRSPF